MKRRKKKNKTRRPRRSGPRPVKPARKRSHTAARGGVGRSDPNGAARLVVKPIGLARTIIYRRNGREFAHQFASNVKLYVTAGGRELVIAKVSVDRSTLQIRG